MSIFDPADRTALFGPTMQDRRPVRDPARNLGASVWNALVDCLWTIREAVRTNALVPSYRQVIAGAGLQNGGQLNADRSIDVKPGPGIAADVDGTRVRLAAADPGLEFVDGGLRATAGAGVPPTRLLTAGAGLTGGGTLEADRTFDVGAGDGIEVGPASVGVRRAASDSGLGFDAGGLRLDVSALTEDTVPGDGAMVPVRLGAGSGRRVALGNFRRRMGPAAPLAPSNLLARWRFNEAAGPFGESSGLRTLDFTSGSREPLAGETLTGHTSGATATVRYVRVSSGTWAGGDAAGRLYLTGQAGAYAAEDLDVGAELNVCTVGGNSTATDLEISGSVTPGRVVPYGTGIEVVPTGSPAYSHVTGAAAVEPPVPIAVWVRAVFWVFDTVRLIAVKKATAGNDWAVPYAAIALHLSNSTPDGTWFAGAAVSGAYNTTPENGGRLAIPRGVPVQLVVSYDGSTLRTWIDDRPGAVLALVGAIDYSAHGPWGFGGLPAYTGLVGSVTATLWDAWVTRGVPTDAELRAGVRELRRWTE